MFLGLGDDAQFPTGSRSLARETQTQEDNFYQGEYLSFVDNTKNLEITIPRSSVVKDGSVLTLR